MAGAAAGSGPPACGRCGGRSRSVAGAAAAAVSFSSPTLHHPAPPPHSPPPPDPAAIPTIPLFWCSLRCLLLLGSSHSCASAQVCPPVPGGLLPAGWGRGSAAPAALVAGLTQRLRAAAGCKAHHPSPARPGCRHAAPRVQRRASAGLSRGGAAPARAARGGAARRACAPEAPAGAREGPHARQVGGSSRAWPAVGQTLGLGLQAAGAGQ